MTKTDSHRGFTIVEVMIVLAIATAVMLIIFLTIGPARRSQRDTLRKNGAGSTIAALEDYSATNSRDLSGFSCPTYCSAIKDPDSPTGHPISGTSGVSATSSSGITYVIGGMCATGTDAGKSTSSPSGSKDYAVLYWNEVTNTSHCMDSAGHAFIGGSSVSGASGGGLAVKGGAYSLCYPDASHCLSYAGGAVYTAWSPTQFVYSTSGTTTGSGTLALTYKNTGPVPSGYTKFIVNIYANGVKILSNVPLPVNPDGSSPGPYAANINFTDAPSSIGVEWTNDVCDCGPGGSGADANFVLLSISLTQ